MPDGQAQKPGDNAGLRRCVLNTVTFGTTHAAISMWMLSQRQAGRIHLRRTGPRTFASTARFDQAQPRVSS